MKTVWIADTLDGQMRRRVFLGKQSRRCISPGYASSRRQAEDQPVELPEDRRQSDPGQASVDWTERAIARALAWEEGHIASQCHLSLAHYPSPSTPPIPQTKLAGKW